MDAQIVVALLGDNTIQSHSSLSLILLCYYTKKYGRPISRDTVDWVDISCGHEIGRSVYVCQEEEDRTMHLLDIYSDQIEIASNLFSKKFNQSRRDAPTSRCRYHGKLTGQTS